MLLASVFLSASLSSCYWITGPGHRTNTIVAGEYWGEDSYNEGVSAYLKVEAIEEEVYKEANGVNVMKDEVAGGYYAVTFTYTDVSGVTHSYDFVNLADAYKWAIGTKISYRDDNHTWLTPIPTSMGTSFPMKKAIIPSISPMNR